jgi:P-type conjugative transfer protein TrbL
MNPELGLLTGLLDVINQQTQSVIQDVMGPTKYIFDRMLTIAIVMLGIMVAYGSGKVIEDSFKFILKIGFLYFVVNNYAMLSTTIVDSMVMLGLKIGGSNITLELMKDPSEIVGKGLVYSEPLFRWMTDASLIDFALNILETIITGLVALIIVCSFFWMGLSVFVTWAEFHISLGFSVIMLAFSPLKQTAWISEGAIKSPVMYAVKFGLQATILSMISPLMNSIAIEENPTFSAVLSACFVSIFFLMLVMKAGTMAAGIVSGSPSLTPGDLAQSALTGAGIAAAGATVAGAAAAAVLPTVARAGVAAASGASTGASLASSTSTASGISKAAEVGAGAVQGGISGVAQHVKSSVGSMASSAKDRLSDAKTSLSESQAAQNGAFGAYKGTGGTPTEGMKTQQAASESKKDDSAAPNKTSSFVGKATNTINAASRIIPSDTSNLNSAGRPNL